MNNNTANNKTMINYGYGGKTLHDKNCGMNGKVRILQRLWLNLETKYCGEVIRDDVQL